MNRRKFLAITGSTAVILAAGGAGFALTRTPSKALRPWQQAGSLYDDPMRKALSYAILAPNPHNRQPWQVRLISDTEAELTCDLQRLLPATDPNSRQIVIGLGCFLELFALAAAANGYAADISVFPSGQDAEMLDGRPIAHLKLAKKSDLLPDPLFAHVLNRHTNREPYQTDKEIPAQALANMTATASPAVAVGTTNSGPLLTDLRLLTKDALQGEIKDPEAFQESVDLMRIGKAEIEANPDGIFLGGAFLETLNLVGVLTRETVADPTTTSFQIGLDMAAESAMSAMGFVWLTTKGNSRLDQIEAGRSYLRVALQATADGLVMQPMSQALQEYPAMAEFYKTIHDQLTDGGPERLQMLARLGYAKDEGPAPRWPLASRLLS
jgi:hypothetical protein